MHVKNNCNFFFNTKSWGTAPRIQPMQVRSASYLSHKNVYCHHWQDALFWSIFHIQTMDNTEYTFISFTGDEPSKIGGGIQYPLTLDLAKQTPWIFFIIILYNYQAMHNWQIIILLLHVLTLLCHPQAVRTFFLSYTSMSNALIGNII